MLLGCCCPDLFLPFTFPNPPLNTGHSGGEDKAPQQNAEEDEEEEEATTNGAEGPKAPAINEGKRLRCR